MAKREKIIAQQRTNNTCPKHLHQWIPEAGVGPGNGLNIFWPSKTRREHAHRTNQKEDGLTFGQVYNAQPNPGPKP